MSELPEPPHLCTWDASRAGMVKIKEGEALRHT